MAAARPAGRRQPPIRAGYEHFRLDREGALVSRTTLGFYGRAIAISDDADVHRRVGNHPLAVVRWRMIPRCEIGHVGDGVAGADHGCFGGCHERSIAWEVAQIGRVAEEDTPWLRLSPSCRIAVGLLRVHAAQLSAECMIGRASVVDELSVMTRLAVVDALRMLISD